MKRTKTLILLFLAASLGFTGCKKDDGEDDAKANIVGKWALTKEVYKTYLKGVLETEETYDDYDDNDWVIELKSNGTYIGWDGGEEEETGTYSLQDGGKTLILKTGNDTHTLTVRQVTSSSLVVYYEETEGTGDNAVKYTYEETYKKL